jgi:hypothetical protein
MDTKTRRAAYAALVAFAVAFGWIEAACVVYLREIYARELSLRVATSALQTFDITLVSLPPTVVTVEIVREGCTLVMLAAVAWLAGRRVADRWGALLLAFGIWDLTYYGFLRATLGWPESVGTWDVLFLIPSPWLAPIWAPATISIGFVAAGTYLFWTAGRARLYRLADVGVLAAAVTLTLVAFLLGTQAGIDHQVPDHFPGVLFWTGVALGFGWFVHVERGTGSAAERATRQTPHAA